MLNKNIYKYLIFLILLFKINIALAQEQNKKYPVGNNILTEKIDRFFLKNPDKLFFVWVPIIKGKSRLNFTIPKLGYEASKKHDDTADLFYLSKLNNENLVFHDNKIKNIKLQVNSTDKRFSYNQNFFKDTDIGFFIQNIKNKKLGLTFKKEFIINNNSIFSLGFEHPFKNYLLVNMGISKLSFSENYELFSNFNYETEKKTTQIEIGNIWFDVFDHYDITTSFYRETNHISSAIYFTHYNKNMKIIAGVDKEINKKDLNLFISLNLNIFSKNNNLNTDINIKNKSILDKYNRISLRDYRNKSAHKIWRDVEKINEY
jgi:hypothetical protein